MPIHYCIFTMAYCAGLFWLSAQSNLPQPPAIFAGEDKIIHAVLYGGLSFIVAFGLRRSKRSYSTVFQFWMPILFAALYGISDEFHQYFVPRRSPDLYDLLADPGESENCIDLHPEVARRLGQDIDRVLRARRSMVRASTVPVDPDTVRDLRAMGYL